ncbi:MAG: type II toxin-antitoxin system RelB/DinJ family antitoxin [Raoultibacter sp.]
MDSMVTARMTQDKKEAGRKVLDLLGVNSSQAINELYDYLIENKQLPFSQGQSGFCDKEELQQAIAFIDSIPLGGARAFSKMTDDKIRQHRLIDRGLAEKKDFV